MPEGGATAKHSLVGVQEEDGGSISLKRTAEVLQDQIHDLIEIKGLASKRGGCVEGLEFAIAPHQLVFSALFLGDVQQHAVIADQDSGGRLGGIAVLERGHGTAIATAEVHLKIADESISLHVLQKDLSIRVIPVKRLGDFPGEQFIACLVAEQVNKSVVAIDDATVGCRNKDAFLYLFE